MDNKCLVVLGNNVFANSLMGTTMQDGGKRERSDACQGFVVVIV